MGLVRLVRRACRKQNEVSGTNRIGGHRLQVLNGHIGDILRGNSATNGAGGRRKRRDAQEGEVAKERAERRENDKQEAQRLESGRAHEKHKFTVLHASYPDSGVPSDLVQDQDKGQQLNSSAISGF